MKNIKNNKGFTLIELLAVIVILGILMIVAIPQVTKYIEQSRKDTFADTAKAYINSARYDYLNDTLAEGSGANCTVGDDVTVPITNLNIDNKGKSPFGGGTLTGYVKIDVGGTADNPTYTYSITLGDNAKKWQLNNIKEEDLGRKSVTRIAGNGTVSNGTVSCTAHSFGS